MMPHQWGLKFKKVVIVDIKKLLNSELSYIIMLFVLSVIFILSLNSIGSGIKDTSLIYLFIMPLFATIKVMLDEVEDKDGMLVYVSFFITFPFFLFWFPLQLITTALMEAIARYYKKVSLDNVAFKMRFVMFFLISFFLTLIGVIIIDML
jgi:hypothetical protein